MANIPTPPQVTLRATVEFLCPGLTDLQTLVQWPPDTFAVAAYLLQRSGAYTQVVAQWPPDPPSGRDEPWVTYIRKLGQRWRTACITRNRRPPAEIARGWAVVLVAGDTVLTEINRDPALCAALVELLAAADEACEGAGIPDPANRSDGFDDVAERLLQKHSTLCERVNATLVRVLPKLHTPQSGITVRSLSHHLALCLAGEVNPRWVYQGVPRKREQPHGLNLLLLPWPLHVSPLYFKPAASNPKGLENMPDKYGFFSYKEGIGRGWPNPAFTKVLRDAKAKVGRIDGIVLPELALASTEEFDQLLEAVRREDKSIFVVAGIGGKDPDQHEDSFCNNSVGYYGPTMDEELVVKHFQHKHHRWRLDESQIRQYGLSHTLDPYRIWWENTALKDRKLHFFARGPWLTFSLLICEDLARQDPVADLLRSVGPNLIIALLMDGPQLQSRWSGRYATVFADDPGSSVLSLTSIGMAQLSRPLDAGDQSSPKGRVIGLWKDACGFLKEIEMPVDSQAVVLTLNHVYRKEWTADGRDDGGTTGYLTFGGIHPIS